MHSTPPVLGHSTGFSTFAQKVMRDGKIIDADETPEDMIERVADIALFDPRDNAGTDRFRDDIAAILHEKKFVPSTPILTNANRHTDRPLSACAVPPISLRSDLQSIKRTVDSYHVQGMGTGFNFDEVDDPVAMLRYLNDVAIDGAKSGKEERPVGNMGVLSVYHPRIREFVRAKLDRSHEWKFNVSVNIDDAFMDAVFADGEVPLRDGRSVSANKLFEDIAAAAQACGDPGLLFIGRMNRDNPTPLLGEYVSTAPCGEVGLAAGETCQFGSVNLGTMVRADARGDAAVDYDELRRVTRLIARYLDTALDFSLPRYVSPESTRIMSSKRKIGVGICGFADMLIRLGIPYDSPEAKTLAEDIMSTVNFSSKEESVRLAEQKGAFLHFALSQHAASPSFIGRRYSSLGTGAVPAGDWSALDSTVKRTGMRNAVTTALPPTGRSSLVFDCSQQIEPIFRLTTFGNDVREDFRDALLARHATDADRLLEHAASTGHCADLAVDPSIKRLFKTATMISPVDHLDMAARFQLHTDESVSKTINLPADANVSDIVGIYKRAYVANLKGITIYRDGSHHAQPVLLSHEKP